MNDELSGETKTATQPAAGWSSGRQISVLVLVAGVLIGVIGVVWLVLRSTRPSVAAEPPPPPAGTFKPSAQQLKTLTIEPVAMRQFVSEERTEGRIAVNADRETPIYSPYSGRITRVIANLGDVVAQGAPLATIEASEFSQAQNDLRTALAQVKLARTSEARKHALYDIKGGSLADWQQAQADLAAAEANFGSVRSRLRILGYTEAQIDQLVTSERLDPTASILAPIHGIIVDRQVGPG
jgi:cobalt-zinc-cadmium efflux system membrane fusion protein